ncbi:sensor histidine kinase [Crocinitomix algicola]|uniref:sensor histidine kinase n=1 Tax=Crocinitomix algicola TaxID=1740263 RepID=UPI000871D682|nr:sensor histidine kinase [Crocinitomix algicola]
MTSYLLTVGCVVLGMVYLYFTKRSKLVFMFYAFAGCFVTQLSCWTIPETNHYVDFIWIIICCFVGFWGGKQYFGLGLIFLNIIGLGYFVFYHYNEHILIIQPATQKQLINFFIEITLCLSILAYLLYVYQKFQLVWEKAFDNSHQELLKQHSTVQAKNDQNIILLKEIHHRVKNNLQIIVSLLRLQKDELEKSESKSQFQEAINRIQVMSSIHQKLYRQNDFENINIENYLNELIEDLKTAYSGHKAIDVELNCCLKSMDLKTMVPAGLLLNELISNSFKYAFKEKENGLINIQIYKTEKGFNIEYSDNGEWKNSANDVGFGMELIEVFTDQLNGTKNFESNDTGSHYTFELTFID